MQIEQHVFLNKEDIISFLVSKNFESEHLLMVFGSRKFLEDQDINKLFQTKLVSTPVMGCTTSGEIKGVEVFDDTLCINLVRFESTKIRKTSVDIQRTESSFVVGRTLVQNLKHPGLKHIFILSDGLVVNGSRLLEGVNSLLPPGVSVSGGLAGDGPDFITTLVCDNDNHFKTKCITAIGFYGENIEISCNSAGGWDTFGIEREVTKSDENVVFEIDNSPALDLYKSYLGDKAKDLPSSGLLFPISMRENASELPLVRTILNVNEEDKSITFAGNVRQGSKIKLMKTNLDLLIDSSEMAAKQIRTKSASAHTNCLAILISCVGRKLVLKQLVQEEVESAASVLNPTTSIAGFYSYGEISYSKKLKESQLHNQSMTITFITENIAQ
jgi:hypothetical protein